MGDASTHEPVPDRTMGDIEVQQLEVEKLGHNEVAGFQRSGTGGVTQEPARMRTCRIGAHEGHVKKPVRKPDKPLLCPRCESYDTKFCYFNNYNVNQPRHFCRNCHRYWTAGGLLRNIPKGAGQRRSKHNITHQKHAVSLDAKALGCNAKTEFLHTQKTLFDLDVGQLVSEDGLSASSTMLSFGQQRPVFEVMAVHSVSVQQSNMNKGSFSEQCPPCVHANVASNRQILEHESYDMHASTSISCQEAESTPAALEHIHRPSEGLGMVLNYSQEEDGNISSSSSMLNTEIDGPVKQEEKGENLGVHDRPPCHFDAAKESHTSTSALYHSSIGWCSFSSTKVSTTATLSNCASTLVSYLDSAKDKAMPMPSDCAKLSEGNFSTTTWNWRPQAMWTHPPWLFMPSGPLASNWAGAYWHMPWFLAALPAGSSTRRPGLQSIQADSEDGGCLWVPKTLRIDDPVEAAQSSIWKTLGLDKAPGFSALRKGTEESFQCEAGTQDEEESSTASQHSLPAALSRSITFTETT